MCLHSKYCLLCFVEITSSISYAFSALHEIEFSSKSTLTWTGKLLSMDHKWTWLWGWRIVTFCRFMRMWRFLLGLSMVGLWGIKRKMKQWWSPPKKPIRTCWTGSLSTWSEDELGHLLLRLHIQGREWQSVIVPSSSGLSSDGVDAD